MGSSSRIEPRRAGCRRGTAGVAIVLALAIAAPGGATASEVWAIPEPGSCKATRGIVSATDPSDAAPLPFQPGQILTFDQLARLREFLPDVLWTYRERFFYEGMRLEIGPCHRDYSAPDFYRAATQKFAGKSHLNERGGLEGYTAGLPFPPEQIDPNGKEVGLKWAWNFENRYQAAGFRGDFRITDLRGLIGRAEPFDGEIFKMQLARRADLPDYREPYASNHLWVAGGLFQRPFNAREFSWRQFRGQRVEADANYLDELHAYIPTMRRVRRLATGYVEGVYVPTFSVGLSQGTESLAGAEAGPATSGHYGTIHPRRSGFEGLAIRPHLYNVTLVGLHDVLTPINTTSPLYPDEPERDYGPWGLSLASDRWDLRRALVLQLGLRSFRDPDKAARIIYHVDLQTLQPLYYESFDRHDELVDIGVFAGRFSEDRPDYPKWADDPTRPVRVIDSVAALFANVDMHGSWRRESGAMVSVPPSEKELRAMVSVGPLARRH